MDIVTLLVDLLIALWFLAVIVAIVRPGRPECPGSPHFHQKPGTSS